MILDSVTVSQIEAARRRLRTRVSRTPLWESQQLTEEFGARVLIKAEHQQKTGSFKIRGATNASTS